MKITITMDESGRFSINMTEGLPLFVALGALSMAQNMLMNNDLEMTGEMEEIELNEEDI